MAYNPLPFGRKVLSQDKLGLFLDQRLLAVAQAYEDRVKNYIPRLFKQCVDEVLIDMMRRKYLKKGPTTVDSSRLRGPGGIQAHSLWMMASPMKYSKAKQAMASYATPISSLRIRLTVSPNAGIVFGYFHEYGFHNQVNVGEYTRRRPGALKSSDLTAVRKDYKNLEPYMITVKAHSKKYNYLGRRYIQPVLEDKNAMALFTEKISERLEKYLRGLGYRAKVRSRGM